jgi:predicted GTPase
MSPPHLSIYGGWFDGVYCRPPNVVKGHFISYTTSCVHDSLQISVVGESGVGKTSLIKQFCENKVIIICQWANAIVIHS